jgi:hypothetical protein
MIASDIVITEGIDGWSDYHLSKADNNRVSLCGVHTMRTRMAISMWGTKTQHATTYCNKCAAKAGLPEISTPPKKSLEEADEHRVE